MSLFDFQLVFFYFISIFENGGKFAKNRNILVSCYLISVATNHKKVITRRKNTKQCNEKRIVIHST